jgi:hypothetical protein
VHEYKPTELLKAVQALFPDARGYRQHSWVATTLTAAGEDPAAVLHAEPERAAEEEIYALVLGGRELPEPEAICVVGSSFEVRWWQEQVDAAKGLVHDQVFELERERAAHAETAERLRVASRRLLATEQELAGVPVLMARLEELETEIDRLRQRDGEHAATLEAARADFEESFSWRVTAPLRSAKRRLRR